jgi:hypothetical protein
MFQFQSDIADLHDIAPVFVGECRTGAQFCPKCASVEMKLVDFDKMRVMSFVDAISGVVPGK